ncbi:linear amide C-N hydrolase [Actinobacillus delphinicola]|uniref:Choloylglycine hydrolase n=1 Tax=Actinobacillus delphinicola TaxID=51161 RepID=A0A448TS98_9PAST|nr:choloylglycine hydrolase family protein [Actinobacillus delphinicola]VEJ08658.1 Choloylglycine hydrolase [Actinobacillus delphinicola]
MKLISKKFLISFSIFFAVTSLACTGISIKTTQNDLLQARTVEYGEGHLNSELIITPRGQTFQSYTPDKKPNGLKWVNRYGYVGISMMFPIFIGEGLNEKGLNAGIFYFPHYGSLAPYQSKLASSSLSDMEFVKWVLGNFATVAEVKEALKKIRIISLGEQNGEPLPTGHWRIADKTGANVVLEITNKGQIHFYDNKVGVLTNSPDYDWQIKNLNNYINLYAGNAPDYKQDNQQLFSFGAGTGMLGLPGDITPPSRFVRAFFYVKTLPTPNNAESGVLSAFHILNNFDIPIGVEYSHAHQRYIPKDLLTATQWTTVSDLSNDIFYYKSMNNPEIKMVDLKKIDFAKISPKILPLDKDKIFHSINLNED